MGTIVYYTTSILVLSVFVFIYLERKYPYTTGIPVLRDGFWVDLIWYTFIQSYFLKILIFDYIIEPMRRGWHLQSMHWLDHWPVALQVLLFLVIHDFYIYWFHRAQHQIPALWAMHSLHHSSEALTVSTGGRHFWFEGTLKRAFLFPLTAWIFAVPASVSATAVLLYLVVDSCAHLNVRVELRAFALWINNPQYHRIHHSARPAHTNRNFADLLPFWDILFGTVWRPGADEWPATGLATGEKPSGIVDGLIWPLRRRPRLSRAAG